jgi:hypothetical protein
LHALTHIPLPLQLEPEAFGSDVVHVCPQLPQLALSICSLTHTPPQALNPMLQAIPQVTPSHVAVPLAGTGQGELQLPPQLTSDKLLSQTPPPSPPPQTCRPSGQRHTPPVHEPPLGHTTPQLPQFWGSVCSLTHVVPQRVSPGLQVHVDHLQSVPQVSDPLVSHAFVAPGPQASGGVSEQSDQADQTPAVHVRDWVPQLPHAWLLGPWQVQTPAMQVEPAAQALLHPPQCPGSVWMSTHDPLHIVDAAPEHWLRQVLGAPASAGAHMGRGVEHTEPHAPQLVAAERLAVQPAPASVQSA